MKSKIAEYTFFSLLKIYDFSTGQRTPIFRFQKTHVYFIFLGTVLLQLMHCTTVWVIKKFRKYWLQWFNREWLHNVRDECFG